MTGFPAQHYHLGHEMASFREVGAKVEVTFANSKARRVDLLVCADGITSTARARLLPGAIPRYAGYVAWRGVLPESALGAAAFERLHDAITYQQLAAGHILVYPIPAAEGSVRAGERLMNMVWYRNVDRAELERVLTDRHGSARPVSVPPGMVSPNWCGECATRRAASSPRQSPSSCCGSRSRSSRRFSISTSRRWPSAGYACSGTPRSPTRRRRGRDGQGGRGRLGARRGTPERRWRRTGRPGETALATPPAETGCRAPGADPLDRRHRTIRGGPDPGNHRLIFGLYEPGR